MFNIETTSSGTAAEDAATTSVFTDMHIHTSGPQVATDLHLFTLLRKHYPTHNITAIKTDTVQLLSFANDGHAKATVCFSPETGGSSFIERRFSPPRRRAQEEKHSFTEHLYSDVVFAKYLYEWQGHAFVVYIAKYIQAFAPQSMTYVLRAAEDGREMHDVVIDELVAASTVNALNLWSHVLVYDEGRWHKDAELWKSTRNARWEDVVLDEKRRASLVKDVHGFFDSEKMYKEYAVPWKRGIMFHGPPGNGKTITLQAIINSLGRRASSVPTLYVKSFVAGCQRGPEAAIRQIWTRARETAPCLLVFEDIDSLVSEKVRSYFLNEVDGIERNDGILMIGSTNHLDRLDPSLSKRPSRFDRKYHFALPNREGRIAYSKFWQKKLANHATLKFPDALNEAVADMTSEFSFAYMKEAFVASLLFIAYADADEAVAEGAGDALEDSALWKVMKAQIAGLREELNTAKERMWGV